MEKEWDDICERWDREEITTEEVKRLAGLIFPNPLLAMVVEEIDVVELCVA